MKRGANFLKKIIFSIGIIICLFGCSNEVETSGFSMQTSPSPNKVNIIELQEMISTTKDVKTKEVFYSYHSFRIYYGEYGSLLEKYKEFLSFDLSNVDHFEILWINDNVVTVKVFNKKDDGNTFEAESIILDTSK